MTSHSSVAVGSSREAAGAFSMHSATICAANLFTAGLVAASSLFAVNVGNAQTGSAGAPARARVTGEANSCLRLVSIPSPLVNSPEGMAVVKLRAELEEFGQFLSMRADNIDPEARREYIIVRSRVDSVVRVMGRSADGNLDTRPRVGGDVSGFLPVADARRQVNVVLRELQPRVADLMRSISPQVMGTMNIHLNTLGYVGLTTSAGTYPTTVDVMRPFAYCDYPRVESVEPASPADRARLSAGDTIIAYNGRDLRKYDVNYQEILIPGKTLRVRYVRDGHSHDASMIVAARSQEAASFNTAGMGACTEAEARNGCRSQQVFVRASPFPQSGGFMNGTAMTVVPLPLPIMTPDGNGGAILAGASVRAIDAQFAQNVGSEVGVLVLQVPTTAAAYQSGLRSGDVITAANGTPVRDLPTLDRALFPKLIERTVTLQVSSRTSGVRLVTLRW